MGEEVQDTVKSKLVKKMVITIGKQHEELSKRKGNFFSTFFLLMTWI